MIPSWTLLCSYGNVTFELPKIFGNLECNVQHGSGVSEDEGVCANVGGVFGGFNQNMNVSRN